MNQLNLGSNEPLAGIKATNLAISFLLELVALVAFGYWGFTVGPNPIVQWVVGLGLPIAVVVVWGTLLAPRARVKLPRPVNFALRLLVFGLAALALGAAGQVLPAWIFAIIVVINYALIAIWKQ